MSGRKVNAAGKRLHPSEIALANIIQGGKDIDEGDGVEHGPNALLRALKGVPWNALQRSWISEKLPCTRGTTSLSCSNR